MLNRQEELSIYIKNKWPLLEIWNIQNSVCACGRAECHAPGKHPVKGQQSARPYANTLTLRLNVGVMCGQGFVVLDIDPRNGGNETLAALELEHGALPSTWTVCTGGGGEHRYFAIEGEQVSQNRLKESGVELKGVGSYVLCPTSNHLSGRVYEWADGLSPEDLPLAPLPPWVLEATKCEVSLERSTELNESADGPSEVYSETDICCALRTIRADCSEKEWKDIACALISGGFGIDLWDEWSKSTAEKYPGRAEIERVWNIQVSRCRKLPADRKITLGTLIYRAQEAGWVPEPIESPLMGNCADVCLEHSIEVEPEKEPPPAEMTLSGPVVPPSTGTTALRLSAQGLIGELACWMHDTSVREYDQLAIAGALAVLSTVAQGSYVTWDHRSVSIYQIGLLPAAGGKDHYLNCTEDVVRAVDSRLVMSNPGSSHGLRGDLFAFNSRLLCMDEVQDFFSKMTSTDNVFVSQVMSDIKQLYNGKRKWAGTSLKTQVMPDICEPRLTWMGFGTPAKFRETINSNAVGGGLLSRLLLWDIEDVPLRSRKLRKEDFPTEKIGFLRTIAHHGYMEDVTKSGDSGFVAALKEYHEGKGTKHLAQTSAKTALTITPEASELFEAYDLKCETLYRASPDSPGGAIMDRASTQVAKIASLHAIGRRSEVVEAYDVQWAIQVADATVARLARMAETWMADNADQRDRQRILNQLDRSGGKTYRKTASKYLRLGVKRFDALLVDLVAQDLVEVKSGKGGVVATFRNGAYPNDAEIILLPNRKR